MTSESILWAARTGTEAVSALYLHVPFCARKCAYCDFASWATKAEDPLPARYAAALLRGLQAFGEVGLLGGADTAYIGGGTPSLLGERLVPVVEALSRLGVSELTSEANPDSVTPALLVALREAGLTRISFGVQSTDAEELRALGRIHTAETALAALRSATEAGLDVSADLMCAIPLQTERSWKRSLEEVLAAGIGHISVYPLAIEEDTAFGRRWQDEEPSWNDPDVQALRMTEAQELLAAHGFLRYEVASYAKPQKRCRHNIAYWTGRNYLGLGTGAASMLSRAAYERARQVLPQLPEALPGTYRVRLSQTSGRREFAEALPEEWGFSCEFLTRRQALAEDLMLAARMARPLDPSLLAEAGREPGFGLSAALQKAQDAGLLGAGLAPTERGWLLGNELFGIFWDLAGDAPTKVQKV